MSHFHKTKMGIVYAFIDDVLYTDVPKVPNAVKKPRNKNHDLLNALNRRRCGSGVKNVSVFDYFLLSRTFFHYQTTISAACVIAYGVFQWFHRLHIYECKLIIAANTIVLR
jgi:hypothetical protein